MPIRYFAACCPGLEDLLAREIAQKLSGQVAAARRGQVEFTCPQLIPEALGCADNLYRVLGRFYVGPHKADLPELTAEVLKDGWFYTGDYGYINEKDQLVISGRKKNIIVLNNGKNVCPEEIEGYIQDIDYINEVVVSGEKDKDGNESSLTAEVYLEEKKTPSEVLKSIKKACVELPIYKQITKVKIRDSEFPKTSSNKIKRFFKETTETVKEKTESMIETVSEKYNEYKESKDSGDKKE